MVSLARKEIWFRSIFHLIGILAEGQFVNKLRKAESAQPSLQWKVELCAVFMIFRGFELFPAPSKFRPTHLPLTRPVGQMHDQLNKK